MKVFDLANPFRAQSVQRFIQAEQSVMNLRHENIVNYVDLSMCAMMQRPGKQSKQVAYIVMELLERALFDVLSKGDGFSERHCRYFFKQLLHGLYHLH